ALDGKPMTFWEHLEELRRRLVWATVFFFAGCAVAWNFHDQMLELLFLPYRRAWIAQHLPGTPSLHFAAPGAAFVADFKLAMIGGGAIAAPFIFYQLWAFVAPGLYAREKRVVVPFVLLSTVLFLGGGFFGWRAAFPISFNYFLGLSGEAANNGIAIVPTVMMGEYIDFCVQMLLGFGLIFEMPLLLLFLSIVGVVNYLHLIKFGRYFILVAFVVAAVVTPPDVPDQLAMAIPMCMLYGVSIGLVYFFGRKPTEAQREAFRRSRQKKT
ncbi:MAG TPA: twin-arginine translocase subunit TatC, partial [Minicystis sp.]|nr:twin-arginine translocase subunit TatC [Minicystis sp.]